MQGSQHGTGAGKEPSCLGRGGSACAARKPRLAAGVVCGGRAASSSSGPVRPKPENVSPRPHVGKRAPPAAAPVGTGCAGSPAGGCAGLAAERGWAARPAAAVGGGGADRLVNVPFSPLLRCCRFSSVCLEGPSRRERAPLGSAEPGICGPGRQPARPPGEAPRHGAPAGAQARPRGKKNSMGVIIILFWLEFSGGREAGWEIRRRGFAARPSAFSGGPGRAGRAGPSPACPRAGPGPRCSPAGAVRGGERRWLLQLFSETSSSEA